VGSGKQMSVRQEDDLGLVIAFTFVDGGDDFLVDTIGRFEQNGFVVAIPMGRAVECYSIPCFETPEQPAMPGTSSSEGQSLPSSV